MYVVKLETIIARIMMTRLDFGLEPLVTFEGVKRYIEKVNESIKCSRNKLIVYPNIYKSSRIDRNSASICDVCYNKIILKECITETELKEKAEVLDIDLLLIMLSDNVIAGSGILKI